MIRSISLIIVISVITSTINAADDPIQVALSSYIGASNLEFTFEKFDSELVEVTIRTNTPDQANVRLIVDFFLSLDNVEVNYRTLDNIDILPIGIDSATPLSSVSIRAYAPEYPDDPLVKYYFAYPFLQSFFGGAPPFPLVKLYDVKFRRGENQQLSVEANGYLNNYNNIFNFFNNLNHTDELFTRGVDPGEDSFPTKNVRLIQESTSDY